MLSNLAMQNLPVQAVGVLDCQLTDVKDADFLAGFIAEFTGNDHKAYFETCYHDTAAFKSDICDAVNAFSTKDGQQVLSGVQKILADMPELKTFLATCPDAATDIAVVNNWMHYWRNAGEMAVYQTAYKNIVPNMAAIKVDASKMTTAYDAGDWYNVAFTAGTVARLALPIMTTNLADNFDCGLTDIVVADLMSGFMVEMPGSSKVDHQTYMEGCFKTSPAFLADMCAVANDFATKDNQKVLEGIKKVLGDLPQIHTSMAACPDAMTDWTLVTNWFTYWKAQGEMKVYQAAYTNFTHNMAAITSDFNIVSADFSAKDFYGAGRAANWGAVLVLPPAATLAVEADFDCGLTDIVVSDLMAGFMVEMPGSSKVDRKEYMEGCFKSSPAFLTDMCAVANDFATKDNQKVLEGIQKVFGDFPQIHTSMAACPEAMTDWTLVTNWFKFWKAQGEMKVYQAAYTNFTHNMAAITSDFNTVSADFGAKDFYGAGRAANWGSVLVLPPPATEIPAYFLQ